MDDIVYGDSDESELDEPKGASKHEFIIKYYWHITHKFKFAGGGGQIRLFQCYVIDWFLEYSKANSPRFLGATVTEKTNNYSDRYMYEFTVHITKTKGCQGAPTFGPQNSKSVQW